MGMTNLRTSKFYAKLMVLTVLKDIVALPNPSLLQCIAMLHLVGSSEL